MFEDIVVLFAALIIVPKKFMTINGSVTTMLNNLNRDTLDNRIDDATKTKIYVPNR